MANRKSTIQRLEKRRDWLDRRIKQTVRDNPNKDMSYDRAELSALNYAIDKLKDPPLQNRDG